MEISVQEMKPNQEEVKEDDQNNDGEYRLRTKDGFIGYYKNFSCFTVQIGKHPILTIVTSDELTAAKWLNQAIKTSNLNSSQILVGLSMKRSDDQLIICFGNHCLIFKLLDGRRPPKFMAAFFSDDKVTAVGMQMEVLKRRMEKVFSVKIRNSLDLNELAVKVINKDVLNLATYGHEKLAKIVLGRHVKVNRSIGFKVREEHSVMFDTVDGFLTYMTGCELLKMSGSKKKKKKAESNKKGKKKIDENHEWGFFDCCF